jgi:glycosyltransferase involved in cell wall biosynthesis
VRLGDGFPFPDEAAIAHAERQLAAIPDGGLVLADGLAFGALPDLAERHAARLALVALVHHPLAYETGLAPAQASAFLATERRALASARAVLCTSTTTAAELARSFGVPAGRIGVALPGTDRRPLAAGSGGPGARLLAVGSISPRKGFVDLARALAPLATLPWRLEIAGSLERNPASAEALRTALGALGLAGRVHLLGEIDAQALDARYQGADLFVSSAAYEGYGMALAEAVASGLPIVAVAGGAVGGWLDSRAALLVPPGDAAALQLALGRAIGDAGLRAELRAGAAIVREALPSWADTARGADALLRGVPGA